MQRETSVVRTVEPFAVPRAEAAAGPRRPGILLVTELFPPAFGGSAVLLHEVYSRLQGWPITVLTDEATSPGPDLTPPGGLTILRRPIGTRQWGFAQAAGTRHHLKVASMIRRMSLRRGTIVHCGRALPEGIAAWLSHLSWGSPYICWSHGEDVTMAGTSRELTLVMRRVYRGAAGVIANSENTRRLVIELGVRPARVHVVYPGVDANRFHPGVDGRRLRSTLASEGDTVLLSVGRLQRRKGHDLVINALAALARTCPRLKYVIVGDGEERERLEQLATAQGVADRVVFAGQVADDVLPEYYAASDVFLMPNREEQGDIEGFGIVFLEAAASGRPVIGGLTGGVREAVEQNVTGVLVGGADVLELAEAIRRFARSASLRDQMGRAGRDRAVERFTWQRAAAEVAVIHAGVSAGPAGAR